MDKYHLNEKLASYCMLTMTRSVCCVSLFLKYIRMKALELSQRGAVLMYVNSLRFLLLSVSKPAAFPYCKENRIHLTV